MHIRQVFYIDIAIIFGTFASVFHIEIMIFHLILLNKRFFSSCRFKNGQTFENPIIGIGDIGLNVREDEIKKILKDGSILTLLKSIFTPHNVEI